MKLALPLEVKKKKKKKILAMLKTQNGGLGKNSSEKKMMDGLNTNQIFLGNVNYCKNFKLETHFLIAVIQVSLHDFDHTSPNYGHSP